MFEYIKRKPVVVGVIVIAFALITRTIDLIPALLIYLIVSSLPYTKTKKVMNVMAWIYVSVSVLFGLGSIISILDRLRVIDLSSTFRIQLYSSGAIVHTFVLISMLVVYVILEYGNKINKAFVVALALPLIGIIYYAVDTLVTNAIYNFVLNRDIEDGFASGVINLGQNSIFVILHVMLLLYIVIKSNIFEEVEKEML